MPLRLWRAWAEELVLPVWWRCPFWLSAQERWGLRRRFALLSQLPSKRRTQCRAARPEQSHPQPTGRGDSLLVSFRASREGAQEFLRALQVAPQRGQSTTGQSGLEQRAEALPGRWKRKQPRWGPRPARRL